MWSSMRDTFDIHIHAGGCRHDLIYAVYIPFNTVTVNLFSRPLHQLVEQQNQKTTENQQILQQLLKPSHEK